MKLTVCFVNPLMRDVHKVVVPCGEGNFTVRDLGTKASLRWLMKAFCFYQLLIINDLIDVLQSEDSVAMTIQTPDGHEIKYFKTIKHDAVLDRCDLVKDVLDDGDLVLACFTDEQLLEKLSTEFIVTNQLGTDDVKTVENLPNNETQNHHEHIFSTPVSFTLQRSCEKEEEESDNDGWSLQHNDEASKEIILYRCGVCDQTFPTLNKFHSHQTTHNDQVLFKCPRCPRHFSEQTNMEVHLVNHQRKRKEVTCLECGKTLKNADNLKRHMFIHTGEKPFLCPECGKGFRAKSDLRVHLRVHTGERPYWCPLSGCGKAFNDRSAFRRHKMVHDKGRKTNKHLPGPSVPVFTQLGADKQNIDNQVTDAVRKYEERLSPNPSNETNVVTTSYEHSVSTKLPLTQFSGILQCTLCSTFLTEQEAMNEHLLTHAVLDRNIIATSVEVETSINNAQNEIELHKDIILKHTTSDL